MNTAERRLAWLLRAIGVVDLLAFVAMCQSRSNIAGVHAWLGLGEFPPVAIAFYLVRSASMLYGLCGLLLLFLSRDVPRYLPVIQFIAFCGMAAGPVLWLIDRQAGLPPWWTALEGWLCALIWGLVWFSARAVTPPTSVPLAVPETRNFVVREEPTP